MNDAGAEVSPNLIVVRSPRGIRQLTTELRDPNRAHPVIGVDTDASGARPVVALGRLREVLDPRIRIYFVESAAMRTRLGQRLGGALIPTQGIRIWWPGLTPDSDPRDHPLVTAQGGDDETLEAFSRTLDRSRPTLQSLYAQLNATAKQLTAREQELRAAERELEEARRTAVTEANERHDNDARLARLTALGPENLDALAAMNDDESMRFSIFMAWLSGLTAADHNSNPLGQYVFGPRFLASVAAGRGVVARERVAFVCAMVASGLLERLRGLNPQPLPDVAQSRKRRRNEREDRAKGWICDVTGAQRLVYWTHPGGRVEFDSVRGHDQIARMG